MCPIEDSLSKNHLSSHPLAAKQQQARFFVLALSALHPTHPDKPSLEERTSSSKRYPAARRPIRAHGTGLKIILETDGSPQVQAEIDRIVRSMHGRRQIA